MAGVACRLGPNESLAPPIFLDPVQGELRARFNIEVPVFPWPAPPKRLLRISTQLYNTPRKSRSWHPPSANSCTVRQRPATLVAPTDSRLYRRLPTGATIELEIGATGLVAPGR